MSQEPELLKCPGCESTSFQVHQDGNAVAVVCTHCGEAASAALRRDDATAQSHRQRAARLAGAMTADPRATPRGDPWTVDEVVNVALGRGFDALESQYLPVPGTPEVRR